MLLMLHSFGWFVAIPISRFLGKITCQKGKQVRFTPWKISGWNLNTTLFWNPDHHHPSTIIFRFKLLIFQGVATLLAVAAVTGSGSNWKPSHSFLPSGTLGSCLPEEFAPESLGFLAIFGVPEACSWNCFLLSKTDTLRDFPRKSSPRFRWLSKPFNFWWRYTSSNPKTTPWDSHFSLIPRSERKPQWGPGRFGGEIWVVIGHLGEKPPKGMGNNRTITKSIRSNT